VNAPGAAAAPPAAGERPRRVVPETIQTSGMDCGPAALRSLLAGFGIDAHYGSLREACRTDVDGTSVDALTEVAGRLGLDAVQVMVPVDHVLLDPPAGPLPVLAVVRLANGMPHFVVLWRRHRRLVQVMDPGLGRRLVRARRVLDDLYVHTQAVRAAAFARYSAGPAFQAGLRHRLSALGVAEPDAVLAAAGQAGWAQLAALDAAVRAVTGTGARGAAAQARLAALRADPDAIPEDAWFARPHNDADGDGDGGTVTLRGAVLLRARGPKADPPDLDALPPVLRAALTTRPRPPARLLLDAARAAGRVPLRTLVAASAVVGLAAAAEATLLRNALDRPGISGALAAVATVAGAMLLVELLAARVRLAIGRRLDLGLRAALADTLPRLPDRYVRSRPASDLAERAHALHELRALPGYAADAVTAGASLLAMVAGLCVLDPAGTPLALTAGLGVTGATVLAQPVLREVELRRREHGVALAQLELDAVLGTHPIRAVRGGPALATEHAHRLAAWRTATSAAGRARAAVAAVQAAVALAVAVPLVLMALPRLDGAASRLLFVFWATGILLAAERLTLVALRWPLLRVLALRLAEPLGAAAEPAAAWPGAAALGTAESGTALEAPPDKATAIALEDVTVLAAGRPVLREVTVRVAPGEHVALVGASGSGKSSLLALVLGLTEPSAGAVRVDGSMLDPSGAARLWAGTAWVSPEVRLWNAPFGVNVGTGEPAAAALAGAELDTVAARLGAANLGDDGGGLSGGEGQRARLARALARDGVRLAVLDEALRGLDRAQRSRLLQVARGRWRDATLLCATHDLADAAGFDRVLVLDRGRVVEDGHPRELAATPGSRFAALLEAERALRADLDAGTGWRRIRMDAGRLLEGGPAPVPSGAAVVARTAVAPAPAEAHLPANASASRTDATSVQAEAAARAPRVAWRFGIELAISLARAGLALAGWALIGAAILDGDIGAERLWPWVAVLATTVPVVGAAAWFGAGTSAALAQRLRQQLFAGALGVDPARVRAEGPGRTLGRVYELEPAATVAATGALGVLLGAVEVAAALAVLAAVDVGHPAAFVLAATVLLGAVAAAAHRRGFRRWAGLRIAATQRLTERLAGHRTALVQGSPVDVAADLDGYDRCARRAERIEVALAELMPRAWVLIGAAALGLAAAAGSPDATAIAVGVGGLLLATSGLQRAGGALIALDEAVVGVEQLRPLLAVPPAEHPHDPPRPGEAVAAEDLTARRGEAQVLHDVDLTVAPGERVLLSGVSGSGKSTLAEVLCGLRPAASGEVRGRATLVPQFHDDHLVLAPLAFNLLLGRAWPPAETDLAAATEICTELGLGPLIERMPAGLAQTVGETGWQLSNGERTLVGLARTLLAEPKVIVLDESLGPLDPGTARRALAVVRERVPTVIVISQE